MIPGELEPLLEPLERFERIRRAAARRRPADLSYANPYAGAREGVRAALRAALDDERELDLQYTPFGGAPLARRAAADALRESHGLPFAFGDVVLTPGAMSALQIALRAAGAAGDEVLVPVPCWLDHPLYARALGMTPRLVDPLPGTLDPDLDALVAAASPRTCAVVVSHPSNPTGRSIDPAELGEALRAVEDEAGRPVTLIADETHRDFARSYDSASAHYARTLVVYSFGKVHHVQGQRLGYAAVAPQHPERSRVAGELVRWTRITGIATPTALMQRALPRLLELKHDLGPAERARARALERLRAAGYELTEPDSTLFVYARTPPGHADDFAFAEALAEQGALVLPAPVFHHAGWFRIALTGTEEMLERGLDVLGEAPGA